MKPESTLITTGIVLNLLNLKKCQQKQEMHQKLITKKSTEWHSHKKQLNTERVLPAKVITKEGERRDMENQRDRSERNQLVTLPTWCFE